MPRILIITYYWPPSGGSGVQRWLKFSKYLPQYGWQPVIYTPSNPDALAIDESLLKEIPSEAQIIKRPIKEPYKFYRLFTGKKGKKGAKSTVNPINNSEKKSLTEKLSLWIRANLFVPDPKITWVNSSVKYLKQYIAEHPIDVVVTTGPPQSMHLIGLGLKKETGIRWIADFRDPWTNIFYFKHLPMSRRVLRKHKKMEGEVVRCADAVISATDMFSEGFRNVLKNYMNIAPPAIKRQPVDYSKFHTVFNGYDEDDFPTGTIAPEEKFCLTHTGLFSSEGNPLKLWKVLGEMCCNDASFKKHLMIRLIGKTDAEVLSAIKEMGLGECVADMGYIPHSEIPVWQRKARVLLLPLRVEPESGAILAGKFFEYLASRRPIIAFGPTDGEMASVLKTTEAGNIFEWNEEKRLRETIEKYYADYCAGVFSNVGLSDETARFSRKKQTEVLVSIL